MDNRTSPRGHSEAASSQSHPLIGAEPRTGGNRTNAVHQAASRPLLVGAQDAARMVGVSVATWWGHNAAGRCPRPVRLGRRTLWRLAELEAWVVADCPPRVQWEAKEARRS